MLAFVESHTHTIPFHLIVNWSLCCTDPVQIFHLNELCQAKEYIFAYPLPLLDSVTCYNVAYVETIQNSWIDASNKFPIYIQVCRTGGPAVAILSDLQIIGNHALFISNTGDIGENI